MKKNNVPMWCCKKCGGTNIEVKMWVDANDDTVLDSCGEEDSDTWCRDCEDHTGIMLIEDWKFENGKN